MPRPPSQGPRAGRAPAPRQEVPPPVLRRWVRVPVGPLDQDRFDPPQIPQALLRVVPERLLPEAHADLAPRVQGTLRPREPLLLPDLLQLAGPGLAGEARAHQQAAQAGHGGELARQNRALAVADGRQGRDVELKGQGLLLPRIPQKGGLAPSTLRAGVVPRGAFSDQTGGGGGPGRGVRRVAAGPRRVREWEAPSAPPGPHEHGDAVFGGQAVSDSLLEREASDPYRNDQGGSARDD
mmetsp:Transcript_12037/g.38114  ORF Transcript_12037/g.38114 Transcript_12037/m.38114 type:complete len:238 (+) Transcript_12037:81-794(+)